MKRTSSERIGKVVEWDSGKGYGFLETDHRRVFLRWRELADLRRQPAVGDSLRFVENRDSMGRPYAMQARPVKDAKWLCLRTLDLTVSAGILAACLFLPLLVWFHYLDASPQLVVAVAIVNVLTFWTYLVDKKRTEVGEWQVPERWLHLLELAGGWPAGWIAQRWLRHKCTQPAHLAVFGLIVAAHQAVAAACLTTWA